MKPIPSTQMYTPGTNASINRRRFLRGLGCCLALPVFESSTPPALRAADAIDPAAQSGAPLRMAFVYFPNGVIQDPWWPTGKGSEFELSHTMEPLNPVKHHLQVISGLEHRNATAGNDGAGDHARANGTFLTGVRVRKTAGADIQAGVSIDQVAAQKLGHLTRFPSLELTCDSVRKSGNCDSGYSCAYQHNLAWSSPTLPLAPEPSPRLVFERLFGAGSPEERWRNYQQRQKQHRSLLDFVLEDARTLERQLTGRDRQKLDEYLTSVRELERRIGQTENMERPPDVETETPTGIPPTFREHVQIMFRMMRLAFQTDSTRIATLLLAGDGNNRAYPDIGVPEGHHHLSHHQNNPEMMEKIARIDRWYVEQLAAFLQDMDQTTDMSGKSLLHNSMIVYGCGNSDGNRHTHHNLPIILAGAGGGRLNPGRYLELPRTPMSNLYLGMLNRFGVTDVDRFGDSTGRLESI